MSKNSYVSVSLTMVSLDDVLIVINQMQSYRF